MDAVNQTFNMKISLSTIQKDLADLKSGDTLGMPAPIEYDTKSKKHRYTDSFDLFSNLTLTDEEIQAFKIIKNSLELYRDHGIFQNFTNAIDKVLDTIQLNASQISDHAIIQSDDPPFIRGAQFLPIIVEAIESSLAVRFSYRKFGETDETNRVIDPYLIKEYRGRWYLVGWSRKQNRMSIFGIDRMQFLEVTGNRFKRKKGFSPIDYFQYAMGITVPPGKPVMIKIQVSRKAGEYLQALPIHSSQKALKEDDQTMTFSMKVYKTHELFQFLLGMGNDVHVISPVSVRNELLRRHKEAINLYNS